MTVTCPSCGRKFNLSRDAIKSPYQKLKCSKCSHIFTLTPEQAKAAKMEQPKDEKVLPRRAFKADAPTAERGGKKKGAKILVVLLVLLVVLGALSYYYWSEYLGAADRWLSIKNLEGQEIVAREGKVFFISGTVLNGSTKPRKFLILRSKLFDKESKVLAEKDVVAGLSMTKDWVAKTPKVDVEKKINDFKLSTEENFQLRKGKEIPFTVIFFDDGFEKAKEFTVEIIESPTQ